MTGTPQNWSQKDCGVEIGILRITDHKSHLMMKDEQMTKEIWYDCRLSVSVRMAICLAKDGINDSIIWLRECLCHVLDTWNVLNDCHLPVTWSWEIKDGEESLSMDLTCFHFNLSYAASEDINVTLRKLTWRLKQRLASTCSHAEVTITGCRTDCPQEIMAFFETTWDRLHHVIHEKVWDADRQEFTENPNQTMNFTNEGEVTFHCACCGKDWKNGGYFAKVHYEGRRNTWKVTLCEDCCILENSCRCDRCGDEFTESFPMEWIDGGLYCEPCSEIEKSERAGTETITQVAEIGQTI